MQTLKLGRTLRLAVIAAACLILAPALAGAQGPPAVTAVLVETMPSVDGTASDTCWEQATASEAGPFAVKAVYDEAELCLLFTYQAPGLTAITPEAVASGRTLAAAGGLSDKALAEAWTAYEYLKASLPGLVPADSSNVQVAAASTNGTWTVELTRDLVTGVASDLQFSDLNEAYAFTAGGTQALLTFAGSGPGLAAGMDEEEGKTGCFCRTTI